MALILHIDTALEKAYVALIKENKILCSVESNEQKNHASFIYYAIQEVLNNSNKTIQDVDAISVSSGPGSYTGLRVGLSAAKGLCYSLNKPLILLNTLELMAVSAIASNQKLHSSFFCAMIDARRMEVFTATYNAELKNILQQDAIILNEYSFSKLLESEKIVFFGSGSEKFAKIISSPNALFYSTSNLNNGIAEFISKAFKNQLFSNLAYCEPNYLKEAHTTTKKIKF